MNKSHMERWFATVCLLFTAIFLVSCVSTNSGNSALTMDKSIVRGTLDNGLTYLIQENDEPENRVFMRLVVKAGSNMEEDDQQGVAHLVEHMAFNGSEHFAENQLVDYFESIGMQFGPEVNAYTSFDETVYMIEVPADDPEALSTGLTILRDWACGLTFDEKELDKERGVVVEEWRLGRGLTGRLTDVQIPLLLKDSRYAQRLPIGKMDVINTVPRQRVVDFYETWYRPELMTVVIVGDAESEYLTEEILKALSDIPASQEKQESPVFDVPLQTTPDVLVFADPEQPYPIFQIMDQKFATPVLTKSDLHAELVDTILTQAFYLRLMEISQSANSPWVDAAALSQNLVKNVDLHTLAFIPKDFETGLDALLTELIRLQRFGVTESELATIKADLIAGAQQLWEGRNNRHSTTLADELVYSALDNVPVISPEDTYALYKEIIPSITKSEINVAAKNWFTDKGTLFIAAIPENVKDEYPSKDKILSLWQNFEPSQPVEPYAEKDLSIDLMEIPQKRGTVIAQESLPGTDIQVYTLANGAQIIPYETDFKANETVFKAISKGGLSLVSDKDYPSGTIALDYLNYSGLNGFSPTELQQKLSGKLVSVSPYINDYSEGLDGSTVQQDLETAMQLINLHFSAPYFTDDAWLNLMNLAQTKAQGHYSQPQNVFADKITEVLYSNDIRKSALTPDYVKQFDQATAQTIYTERFASPSDFIFVFVGDFETEELLDLAELYIGSLPASDIREEGVWQEPDFPRGVNNASVQKGLEDQSSVFMAFGGTQSQVGPEEAYTDNLMISALQQVLDIRLREVIREDKSGSYGIGVSAGMSYQPEQEFYTYIQFGCEPGRENELSEEVINQIEILQKEGIADSYITKVSETYKRSMETALKTNSFWLSTITQAAFYGIPVSYMTDTESLPKMLSPETIQETARKYLNTDNYVKVYLQPEAKK